MAIAEIWNNCDRSVFSVPIVSVCHKSTPQIMHHAFKTWCIVSMNWIGVEIWPLNRRECWILHRFFIEKSMVFWPVFKFAILDKFSLTLQKIILTKNGVWNLNPQYSKAKSEKAMPHKRNRHYIVLVFYLHSSRYNKKDLTFSISAYKLIQVCL